MNKGQRGFSAGHILLALLFLGGVWLLLAPTWVGFSAHRLASRTDEWAGAALMVITAATFVIHWALSLSALVKAHQALSGDGQ